LTGSDVHLIFKMLLLQEAKRLKAKVFPEL